MALSERLKGFFDQHRIQYQTAPHREVFTAQEVAQASHVPGRHLAKVLLVMPASLGPRSSSFRRAITMRSCGCDTRITRGW